MNWFLVFNIIFLIGNILFLMGNMATYTFVQDVQKAEMDRLDTHSTSSGQAAGDKQPIPGRLEGLKEEL